MISVWPHILLYNYLSGRIFENVPTENYSHLTEWPSGQTGTILVSDKPENHTRKGK